LEWLLDPDSFEEGDSSSSNAATILASTSHKIPGDGVVTGYGTVTAGLVFVFSQDFTVSAGRLSEAHAEKICKLMWTGDECRAARDRAQRFPAEPDPGRGDRLPAMPSWFERNVLPRDVVPRSR